MATQPPYGWRVPLDTDKPAGARQIRELAEDVAGTMGTLLQGNIRGTWTSFAITAGTFPNQVNTLIGSGTGGTVSSDGITVSKAGFWLITAKVDASGAPFPAGTILDVDTDTPAAGANAFRALVQQGGNTGTLTALMVLAAQQKINIGVSATAGPVNCTGMFTMKWLGEA
jgi:hypothetical protein